MCILTVVCVGPEQGGWGLPYEQVVEQGDSTSDPEMVEAARRYLDDIYELYGASDRPEEDPEDDASGLMPFRY